MQFTMVIAVINMRGLPNFDEYYCRSFQNKY